MKTSRWQDVKQALRDVDKEMQNPDHPLNKFPFNLESFQRGLIYMLAIGFYIGIGTFLLFTMPLSLVQQLSSFDEQSFLSYSLYVSILMYYGSSLINHGWSWVKSATGREIGAFSRFIALVIAGSFVVMGYSGVNTFNYVVVTNAVFFLALIIAGEWFVMSFINRVLKFLECKSDSEKPKNEHQHIDLKRLKDVAILETQSFNEAVPVSQQAGSDSAPAARLIGIL